MLITFSDNDDSVVLFSDDGETVVDIEIHFESNSIDLFIPEEFRDYTGKCTRSTIFLEFVIGLSVTSGLCILLIIMFCIYRARKKVKKERNKYSKKYVGFYEQKPKNKSIGGHCRDLH